MSIAICKECRKNFRQFKKNDGTISEICSRCAREAVEAEKDFAREGKFNIGIFGTNDPDELMKR